MNEKQEKGRLIIFSGFAGSGKGTILSHIFPFGNYKYSISATTRLPRSGEVDGVNYYFLSIEEFKKKIENNELLEYVEYSGNYYGTLSKPVFDRISTGYDVILEIDVKGALRIKELYEETLMIFITPPTFSELRERLYKRATEAPEVIEKRLEISKIEIKSLIKYDYFFINENNMAKETAIIINDTIKKEKENKKNEICDKYKVTEKNVKYFIEHYFKNKEIL